MNGVNNVVALCKLKSCLFTVEIIWVALNYAIRNIAKESQGWGNGCDWGCTSHASGNRPKDPGGVSDREP